MSTEIPPELLEYMDRRRQAAADRANAILEPLTAREISLVRDAAVMGFVQGMMHGRYETQCPKDADIMADVLHALTGETEGYPVIRGEAHEYRDIKPQG